MEAQVSPLLKSLQEQWKCSISQQTIKDPVLTSEGITYERESLQNWFKDNDTEPQTRKKLKQKTLIPNIALRNLIDRIQTAVPQLQFDVSSRQAIIQNHEQQIRNLKRQLQLERYKNQVNDDLMQETIQKSRKIKKIQKNIIQFKTAEKQKLAGNFGQNLDLKNSIYKLRIQNKKLKNRISDKQKSAQQLKEQCEKLNQNIKSQVQTRYLLKSQIRDKIKDIKRSQTTIKQLNMQVEDLKRVMEITLSNINQQMELQRHYQKLIFERVRDQFYYYLQRNRNQEINQQGDIILIIKESVSLMLQEQKVSMLKQQLDESSICLIKTLFQKMMKYISKNQVISKFNHIQQCVKLISCNEGNVQRDQICIGNLLKFIPYSVPPTQQEIKVNWKSVLKIQVGQDFAVLDNLWEVFIQRRIVIRNCKIVNITLEQLQSIPAIQKIVFLNTVFSEGTIQQIQEFQDKYRSAIEIEFSQL